MAAFFLPLLLLAASAAPAREWHFDVSVDGLPIGTHDVVLHEQGESRSVQSDMKFGVMGMHAYQQHAEESWHGDCLARIDTRTEEKGNVVTVAGRKEAGGFEIDGARGRQQLPACVMSFAYWNTRVLKQTHLINTQTGVLTPIAVKPMGKDSLDVRGKQVDADHFRIDTERNQIEVWYSTGGEWVGLRSTTRSGGHVLTYRLR